MSEALRKVPMIAEPEFKFCKSDCKERNTNIN